MKPPPQILTTRREATNEAGDREHFRRVATATVRHARDVGCGPLGFRLARYKRKLDDIASAPSRRLHPPLLRSVPIDRKRWRRCPREYRLGRLRGCHMTDQGQGVSFADTVRRSQGGGSTTDRPTSAPHESVAELRVDNERPAATADLPTAAPTVADEVAAARMTGLYGIHRDDGVWVTMCAWCKRVRSVAGDWQTLAPSVRGAIRAERTHGICSECADRCLTQVGGVR